MRELFEFRVDEEFAPLLFRADEGQLLGEDTRKVIVDGDDPRFPRVGQLQDELRQRSGSPFFYGWDIYHRYSKRELESAELYHLLITAYFEPTGEECGTEYDYSQACDECGMPRRQVSELRLDLRKAPKKKGFAQTIADDEWIVSQRLAELLVDAKLTGFDLRPVSHKARYEDDSVDLGRVPTGRSMLRRAEAAGIERDSNDYYVWLNRPEQRADWERAVQEHGQLCEQRALRRPKTLPIWYQLVITAPPVPAVHPTRFGNGPFDDDTEGQYKCRLGHVRGLNLLSEVSVERDAWDGSDIARTEDLVGMPRRPNETHGVRVPAPMLLISPRFRELFVENKVKGCKTEVAYLR